ncbi:MAG: hypothetical protein V4537_00585 [Pseudomonadota bacterium]
MPVSTLLAVLLSAQVASPSGSTTATPAPGQQNSARAAAGAEIGQRAQAFAGCIGPKVPTVARSLTPEQGADSVLTACKAEQTALQEVVETMIAMAPADRQAGARQQLADSMTQARTQVADAIRQSRAATPAAPAK